MKIDRSGDAEENEMNVEEMKAEKKRLLEAIAKEERHTAILLAASAWDSAKGTE